MSKATHNGTCQCCGSLQKLPGGKLSLHGYEVARYSFFNGICAGARHLPFEQSKDLVEHAINSAQDRRVRLQEKIEAVHRENVSATDESRECWYHVYHRELSSRTRGSVYMWDRVKLMDGGEDLVGSPPRPYVKFYQVDGSKPELIRSGYPEFRRFIREHNGGYIEHLKKVQAEIDDYVAWQRRRIEGWAPKPLIPVTTLRPVPAEGDGHEHQHQRERPV